MAEASVTSGGSFKMLSVAADSSDCTRRLVTELAESSPLKIVLPDSDHTDGDDGDSSLTSQGSCSQSHASSSGSDEC